MEEVKRSILAVKVRLQFHFRGNEYAGKCWMDISAVGRSFLLLAIVLCLVGLLLVGIGRLTGGRGLPGDLIIHRDRVTVYFPLVTSILVSVIVSLLLSFAVWFLGHRR